MNRTTTIIATLAAGLIFESGFALGQWVPPPPNVYQEVLAAQDSLEEAMRHLENIRGPDYPVFDRAYALVLLAHTELGPTLPSTRGGGRSLPYDRE